MHIKPQIPYLDERVIEEKAAALLRRAMKRWPIDTPPVPIEKLCCDLGCPSVLGARRVAHR